MPLDALFTGFKFGNIHRFDVFAYFKIRLKFVFFQIQTGNAAHHDAGGCEERWCKRIRDAWAQRLDRRKLLLCGKPTLYIIEKASSDKFSSSPGKLLLPLPMKTASSSSPNHSRPIRQQRHRRAKLLPSRRPSRPPLLSR